MDISKVEQGRAEFAFKKVKEVVNENFASDYQSYVKKMPVYIKTNGLLGALVFAFSKEKNKEGNLTAWGHLLNHIKEYVQNDLILKGFFKEKEFNSSNEFIKKVTSLEVGDYQLLSNQILAFLNWFRRFAEGMIKKEEKNNN